MSQRIKELATQADIWTDQNYPDSEFYEVRWEEKFAELIIKDCLNIIEGYCETSPEIYGLPLDILEHFDMEITEDE